MTQFDDVPPWPDKPAPRDPRHDNQPPLEERILLEFEDDLAAVGITARVAQLLESADRAPEVIEDAATAGKVGDLVKLAREVEKRIDEAREKHNRPLLTAQRALKAKADGAFAGLGNKVRELRERLNHYMAEEDRKRREEERRREAEARRIREDQEGQAREAEEAGTVTVWKHEIEVPIAKLPKAILENATVREAVDKVIRASVRGGTREIKGVRIYSEQQAAVR
jgi:hypothetical protein